MITHYFRTVKDTELKTSEDIRTGMWTHAVAPSEEEIALLVESYGLDAQIVADSKDFFEVPRFERSGSVSYFFTRYPFDEKKEDTDSAPLLIVVGESFVLTVAQRDVPFLKPFFDGREEIVTTQKTKLFIQFMSALTSSFDHDLTRMRKAVYRDRTRVQDIHGQDIQRLVTFEHKLNDTLSAIVPTNAWLQQLTVGSHIQMYTEDVALMEDLMIANSQLADSARSVLKTIQNIRGASEAILTQQLNSTIKMLTALTIILTIPTIVSSLYGMNVPLPLADHPYSFWLVGILIVTTMAIVTHFFIQKRWF
ncbi:magnesium transporter CorA family protein [Candidatus Parcubacteria bacterium]|uniref:Magnesium transporter CorA n=1 Tax=Candidatus Kaiserbacteria bacterium CG10_big_fil_rev_8_21_14_0_10_47_16 TaxID=1974608 RepID=A0A2H0UDW6_9BACT|nr:magnesium transporter CorA family protein [Candidatus Parcubacteria bacterium]PIR84581.1 MAG: hypothetical protein COU16_03325 [Candidatus Kaiserbacteria bacterium CG10_big_fil_rev_8_21_14_0_10_47_16]